MHSVLGIDPGYRNFATCVLLAANPRVPMLWKNEDIFPASGKASEEDIFRITIHWCTANKQLLDSVSLIVIESQMQARFKIMTTVIRSIYAHKTVLVSPNRMTAHYGLTNKRAQKKLEAICWCNVFFDTKIPRVHGKCDDMADAALLALMGLTNEMQSLFK